MNQSPQIELPFDPMTLVLEGLGNAVVMLSQIALTMPWWFWIVLTVCVLIRLNSGQKHRPRRGRRTH